MVRPLHVFSSRLGTGAARLLRKVRGFASIQQGHGGPGSLAAEPERIALNQRAKDLERMTAELEKRFMATGSSLERHAEQAQEIVQRSERLLELVTGKAGGEQLIRTGMETLGQGLDFIERCHVRTLDLVGRLRGYQEQLESMRRHEELLGGALSPLKYVQTLFRIESASLPADVQSTFLGLTRDIEELFGRFGQVFGEQYQNLGRSRDSIAGLIDRIERHAVRQQATAVEKRNQMRQTLGDLMAEVSDSMKRDVSLVSVSRSIDSGVAEVLVALQCQDIVRQKLEHVRSACGQIVDVEGGTAGLPAVVHRQFARDAARIQVEQIDAVVRDLRLAEEQGRKGVHRIIELAQELDAESMSLSEFKSVTSSEDGMVQILLSSLEEVRAMLTTIVAVQDETHRTLQPLGGMASNVTGVMRQLSGHIKLIALNAQIQAAQVGQGTGLEVLSENTTRISDEIYRLNEHASDDLDRLIAGLAEAIGESAALHAEAVDAQGLLDRMGRDLEVRLHVYRDATLDSFMAVGQSNAVFTAEATATEMALKFVEPSLPILEALRGALARIADRPAEEIHDPEAKEALESRLRVLQRNYTMQSERNAHAAAAAVADDAVSLWPGTPPASGAADPVGGSVELFDSPAAPPAPPASEDTSSVRKPEPSDRGIGANVELF